MLSDPLIGNKVNFVFNNLHTLPTESESTKKLMTHLNAELGLQDFQRHRKIRRSPTSQSVEVFPTVSGIDRSVRVIDLGDPKHKIKVQSDWRDTPKEGNCSWREEEVQQGIIVTCDQPDWQARSEQSGSISFGIQLEELSTDSDLTVCDIIESTPQDLKTLLSQAWKQMFQPNMDKTGKVKEILRTMVLTYEDPSEMELGVIAGLSSTDEQRVELHNIVEHCKPLLFIQPSDPTISFINAVVKTHLLENAKALLGLSRERIKWQQDVWLTAASPTSKSFLTILRSSRKLGQLPLTRLQIPKGNEILARKMRIF